MALPRCAILVHVYHPEVWEEMAARLRGMEEVCFDLYVNAVHGRTTAAWRERVCRQFPGARVFEFPNLGQDVGGTVALLEHVDLGRYDLICKLHTKKSTYLREGGAQWRHDLLSACLESPREVLEIFASHPDVTMLGSAQRVAVGNGMNQRNCERLCDRLKLDRRFVSSPWVAGCMFWCRPYVMQALKDAKLRQDEFQFAYGHDGTLAHALERVFGALAASRGEIHWRTPSPSLSSIRTNGSIVRHQDRLLLAYRHGFPWSSVGLAELDDRLNVLSDRELELPVHRGPQEALSDPRLISISDRLYCSYVHEHDLGTGSTQLLCRFSEDFQVEENISFPKRNGRTHEKNWGFFESDGRLLFVYSIQPEHIVMDLRMNEVARTECKFPWTWGQPRGGTPPVRVGDEYVSFFT